MVAPKNPAVSLIVPIFIPGVGSIVNGDTVISVVILLLWLLSIGLDFMEILGHSQISTTVNTYGHVLPETMKDAAERMGAILAR